MGTNKLSFSLMPRSEQKQRTVLNCKENAVKGRKPIKCLNNGILYPSIAAAGIALKLDRESINRVVKEKSKDIKGFRFEYADTKEDILDEKKLYTYTLI